MMGPLMTEKLPCNLSGSKSALGGGNKFMILPTASFFIYKFYKIRLGINYPYNQVSGLSLSLSLNLISPGLRGKTEDNNV